MKDIEERLYELEKIVSSRDYHWVSKYLERIQKNYPEEIQEVLNIRKHLYSLPESPLKSSLLSKTIEILYNYLSKGGILKGEDLREFFLNVPMDKDISVILPSLGYPYEIVEEIDKLADKDIRELPPELRVRVKNLGILWYLFFELLRKKSGELDLEKI
jgi:hypothetical protein